MLPERVSIMRANCAADVPAAERLPPRERVPLVLVERARARDHGGPPARMSRVPQRVPEDFLMHNEEPADWPSDAHACAECGETVYANRKLCRECEDDDATIEHSDP